MLPLWILNLADCVSFDLFCNSILVIFVGIFFYLNANYLRDLTSTMADTLTPQTSANTPPKKLFKPSSKTKTPTPVKRANSTNVTPRSVQSPTFPASSGSPAQRRFPEKPREAARESTFRSIESPSEPVPEDIAKSTTLAPLTSFLDTSSHKIPEYATSDTTGDTPIGLVDHGIFTPSDTVSRSTEGRRSHSRDTTETLRRDTSETRENTDTASEVIDTVPRSSESQLHEGEERLEKKEVKPTDNAEVSQKGSEGAPTPSNLPEAVKSPTDIANYFAESGNQELSNFVKALAGSSSDSAAAKEVDDVEDSEKPLPDAFDESSPDDRVKEATDHDVGEVMPATSNTSSAGAAQNVIGDEQASHTPDKQPDLPDPTSVSQKAEGAPGVSEATETPTNMLGKSGVEDVTRKTSTDDKQRSLVGDPDTSKIAKDAKVDIQPPGSGTTNAPGNARKGILKRPEATPTNGQPKGGNGSAISPEVAEDGTQSFDNMGKPAHIERSIEIPFERSSRRQSVVHSPPPPSKPELGNIANSLGNVKDLPSTENLAGTDDLQEVPDDPPEEILDPSVHSPSANVSPIPKIPKITPIGMAPPQNLPQLARGLAGKMVDDVGNVVDESGNVLGHALGDLPAMVGKKVNENGEVYGDDDELIGYVTENFTDSASATQNPGGPWGGLQIDHDGNILDATGSVIGRFFQKPGERGQVPSSGGNAQQDPEPAQNPKQEEKPKVNAHTGGSPSDIFLDVKSTTDGIQLTIRIPTTFGLQRSDT